MERYKEEISIKGKARLADAFNIDDIRIIVTGKIIKTASIKEEEYVYIKDPECLIRTLRDITPTPDIFTFWQGLHETKLQYNYYSESESHAVLPVKSFDYWRTTQITKKNRHSLKKAEKQGVLVKVVQFDDELVRGIMNIFNETPVRRGKPFWHYRKDFETVKKEMGRDLERSDFIGAYYNDELIGFIKLLYTEHIADPVQILSKIEHRDKCPNNALLAKAVELCEIKKIPYIWYGSWRRGTHGDFLRRNGFEKIQIPRYYVPLTTLGKIILKIKLHHGIKGIIPEKIMEQLLELRANWYESKAVAID